jgi:hypothetical protein
MNSSFATPNNPLPEEVRVASDHVHAELAKKRAQRGVRSTLESIPDNESDFQISKTANPTDDRMDLDMTFGDTTQGEYTVSEPSETTLSSSQATKSSPAVEKPAPEAQEKPKS